MFNTDLISDNAASFSRSLMELCEHVDGEVEKVVRKACIDLYRRIVQRTPIDTGRAKANWQISTSDNGSVRGSAGDSFSESDIQGLIASETSGLNITINDNQVIIYNNLEYIGALENGHSQQAPGGMVVVSLADFTQFFNEAIAEAQL